MRAERCTAACVRSFLFWREGWGVSDWSTPKSTKTRAGLNPASVPSKVRVYWQEEKYADLRRLATRRKVEAKEKVTAPLCPCSLPVGPQIGG